MSDSPLTEGDVDIIVYVMGGASIIGYLITGIIADKFGRKILCYIYSLIFPISIITIIFGVNLSRGASLVVSIGAGLANVSYWGLRILINIITLEIIPTQARGTGAGTKTLISSVGITVGLILSSIITFNQGLAVSFIVFSMLFIIIIALIFLFLRETKGINLSEIE
ncbi:MAG: MFS transporter [Promethearchaeota archaeon]